MVKTGADVFGQTIIFEVLSGRRIGFVGNQTALLSSGIPTLAALAATADVSIGALFAPEHGAFGTFDTDVPDQIEPATGLPIHSLYGDHKKPAAEWLASLDALVFEMQDIGARFYTYASTLGLCLEACTEADIELIVLDRPNPITGVHIEGPCADSDRLSFTAYHTIPVRHGLTLGEMAKLYAAEKGYGRRVIVAPCDGWRRAMWFDETGLKWTNPSPAMRNLRAATLYPGLCLLEQTNVALGRGTDLPFERIGAPYIDAGRFASAINAVAMAGVVATPDHFAPTLREFSGEECHGVRLSITDREAFNAVTLGLTLINVLMKLCPEYQVEKVINLVANKAIFDRIASGEAPKLVVQNWRADLETWQGRIAPHLIYR